jgi:hypothetical protein
MIIRMAHAIQGCDFLCWHTIRKINIFEITPIVAENIEVNNNGRNTFQYCGVEGGAIFSFNMRHLPFFFYRYLYAYL